MSGNAGAFRGALKSGTQLSPFCYFATEVRIPWDCSGKKYRKNVITGSVGCAKQPGLSRKSTIADGVFELVYSTCSCTTRALHGTMCTTCAVRSNQGGPHYNA